MIYKIFADGRLLYSSQYGATDRALIQPRMKLEMGKAGSLSFTILPSHYLYNEIHEMTTVVTVYCDDVELFRGRMLKFQDDFFKQRKVSCESNLAYLLDSVVYPFKQTMTVSDFVDACLNDHNLQMEAWKRFTLGNVTIDEASTSVKFELSSNQQTSSVLESEVLNVYGGFLRTRYENGTQYLDYIKEYGISGDRPIRFGWNIESLERTSDGKDLYTMLMPVGKDDITIAEVNQGSRFLPVSQEMVQRYGTIIKTHSFSNVSKPAELKQKALKYIQDNFKGERALGIDETFKIKALDMHMLDGSIDQIVIGCKAAIVSQPHGLDILKDCIAIEYNFEDPSQNTYEFGIPPETKEEKDKRASSSGLGGGLASSLATAQEEAAEAAEKKIYDAYIKADPEAGTVSLYGMYQQYADDLVVLKQEVGIDLDAQAGSAIIESITTDQGVVKKTHFGVLKDQIESKVSSGDFTSYVQQTAEEISSKVDASTYSTFVSQTAEQLSSLIAQTGVSGNLETWDPSKEGGYHTGDQVVYEGVWYRFTADYSGSTWDPTKVQRVDSQQTEITATTGRLTALVTLVGSSSDSGTSTLYGKLNVEAGIVEQIVTSVGSEGQVTAASIVTAINGQTGQGIVAINADMVNISGNVNVDDVIKVSGGNVVIEGDLSTWDDLSTRVLTVTGDEGADVQFNGGYFACNTRTGFGEDVGFNASLTCYVDPTSESSSPITINSHSHKITITEVTSGQHSGEMLVDLGEMTNTDADTQAYFKIADTITCQSLVAAAGAVSATWSAATDSFTATTGGNHIAVGTLEVTPSGWIGGVKTFLIQGTKSIDGSADPTPTTLETLTATIPDVTTTELHPTGYSIYYNASGNNYSISYDIGGKQFTFSLVATNAYDAGWGAAYNDVSLPSQSVSSSTISFGYPSSTVDTAANPFTLTLTGLSYSALIGEDVGRIAAMNGNAQYAIKSFNLSADTTPSSSGYVYAKIDSTTLARLPIGSWYDAGADNITFTKSWNTSTPNTGPSNTLTVTPSSNATPATQPIRVYQSNWGLPDNDDNKLYVYALDSLTLTDDSHKIARTTVDATARYQAGQNSVNVTASQWNTGSRTYSPSVGTGSSMDVTLSTSAAKRANDYQATVYVNASTNNGSAVSTGIVRDLYLKTDSSYAYISKEDSVPTGTSDSDVVAFVSIPQSTPRSVESLSAVTLVSGDNPTTLKTVTVSYTDQTSEDKSIRINSSNIYTAGQNSVNVSKGTWSNGSITFSPSVGTGSSRTLSVGVYADLGGNNYTATVKAWDITNGVSYADETGASRNLYLKLSDGYAYITKSDSYPYNYHDSNVVAYATYPTYSVQYKTVEYTSNGNYTISPSSGYDAISSVDVRVYVQSSAPSVSCSTVGARIIEPPSDYTTVTGPSASNCVTGNWIHFTVFVGSNTYGFKARIT